MIVGELRDGRQRVQEFLVLEMVAEQLVLDVDLATEPVEEELAVWDDAIPFVQPSQELEFGFVVEMDMVEDARGDHHHSALAHRLHRNDELGAAVLDFEPVVADRLVCEARAPAGRASPG